MRCLRCSCPPLDWSPQAITLTPLVAASRGVDEKRRGTRCSFKLNKGERGVRFLGGLLGNA